MDIESDSILNVNLNSRGCKSVNEEKKSMKSEFSNPLFVNHAELAWHEIRRAWVGDKPQTSHSKFRQPILSWTTSFEDLLTSGETFPDPIQLADVMDLLVDIWDEEAELAWHEIRRAWVDDKPQTSHSKFRRAILSWTTSFEDLLASGETFPDPIQLADVVDLLVDI